MKLDLRREFADIYEYLAPAPEARYSQTPSTTVTLSRKTFASSLRTERRSTWTCRNDGVAAAADAMAL